ncbi:6-carboxyhexanoate--CoA ligase [Candidatus Magnetomonas plexicatena]|uniref:6-carboxyhexanoate--CoA ligase n=1 Tax=Candidatus Magnetomonas plexicatena TaxID=2552947 RepID=UPI001C78946C|nr:6-carboxyhexanoate--CoA ligase [Nitrospirales bacterium LBB_01]
MTQLYSIRMRAEQQALHVSGAEDIVSAQDIQASAISFITRALNHAPEKIVITMEKLDTEPIRLPLLPLVTCNVKTTESAHSAVRTLLSSLKICDEAVDTAFSLIFNDRTVAGAYLIDADSGQTLRLRNSKAIVRVSRFGLLDSIAEELQDTLNKHGLTHHRVKEALTLASKVCSSDAVVAELCVSDDPNYTTGYVASKKFGYVRLPHIKKLGNPQGGRVVFLKNNASLSIVIKFLEKTPVLFDTIPEMKGVMDLDEITGSCNS